MTGPNGETWTVMEWMCWWAGVEVDDARADQIAKELHEDEDEDEPLECSRCGARYSTDPSCGKSIHLCLPDPPPGYEPKGGPDEDYTWEQSRR